jgi:ABC-type sugar transport system substrate-binding protein
MRRLLWAAALLAFVGGGCQRGASTGSTRRPVVGVTLLTQTHAFFKELEEGLREQA